MFLARFVCVCFFVFVGGSSFAWASTPTSQKRRASVGQGKGSKAVRYLQDNLIQIGPGYLLKGTQKLRMGLFGSNILSLVKDDPKSAKTARDLQALQLTSGVLGVVGFAGSVVLPVLLPFLQDVTARLIVLSTALAFGVVLLIGLICAIVANLGMQRLIHSYNQVIFRRAHSMVASMAPVRLRKTRQHPCFQLRFSL